MKLNAQEGFAELKRVFPALARLEDKEGFRELAAAASEGGSAVGRVSRLLEMGAGETPTLANLLTTDTSRISPSSRGK